MSDRLLSRLEVAKKYVIGVGVDTKMHVVGPGGAAKELQSVRCEQAGVLHWEHPCCKVEKG